MVDNFNTYVPLCISITLTAVAFVANLLLHVLVMYLYYKVKYIRDLVPKFMRTPTGNLPMKPLVTVASNHSDAAATYVAKKERNFTLIRAAELARV